MNRQPISHHFESIIFLARARLKPLRFRMTHVGRYCNLECRLLLPVEEDGLTISLSMSYLTVSRPQPSIVYVHSGHGKIYNIRWAKKIDIHT